jgi:hypothetical protein
MDETKESSAQASMVSEPADFVCDCSEEARPACAGERFYKEHEGKRYCVLHYPGIHYPGKEDGVDFDEALKKLVKEKSAYFDDALRIKRQAKDFNFRGVWFPGALDLSGVEFCSEASFEEAIFTTTPPSGAHSLTSNGI